MPTNTSIKFKINYGLIFLVLLITETLIAVFVHDRFIRPFVGDILVIFLIYTFLRTIYAPQRPILWAAGIFLFACLVEIGQHFNLVQTLRLENNPIACIILGTTFDWLDIFAYFIGTILLFIFIFGQKACKKTNLN